MDDKTKAVIDAARQYVEWAKATRDHPHDERGAIAHEALLKAVAAYEFDAWRTGYPEDFDQDE